MQISNLILVYQIIFGGLYCGVIIILYKLTVSDYFPHNHIFLSMK